MKMIFFLLLLSGTTFAQTKDYGYLKADDQKFYKNDSFEGQNKQERIDSVVKEINKLYGEITSMKSEIAGLKAEVEALKSKK